MDMFAPSCQTSGITCSINELTARNRQERERRHPARGLSEDGDVVGITPESTDVVAYPLQREHLVVQAEVSVADALVNQVPEYPQPVVHRHHDDIAALRHSTGPRRPRETLGVPVPHAGESQHIVVPASADEPTRLGICDDGLVRGHWCTLYLYSPKI